MKYLGIDYGKKNVGLAVSDSTGQVAMPWGVLENNEKLLEKILEIISNENIKNIVVGWSLDFNNQENNINVEIKKFADLLKNKNKKIKIFFQDERFTSLAAKWGTVKEIRRDKKKNKKKKKQPRIDDKAATLILQTFLEQRVLED